MSVYDLNIETEVKDLLADAETPTALLASIAVSLAKIAFELPCELEIMNENLLTIKQSLSNSLGDIL